MNSKLGQGIVILGLTIGIAVAFGIALGLADKREAERAGSTNTSVVQSGIATSTATDNDSQQKLVSPASSLTENRFSYPDDSRSGRTAKAPTPSPEPRTLSTREIVELSDASVAQIKGKFSQGTGFLAKPKLLITNSHVIQFELCHTLEVYFPTASDARTKPYKVMLLSDEPKCDLAILAIEVALPPLELARSYTFRKGDDVTIIGSPGLGPNLSLQNAISRGVVSTEVSLDGRRFYQLGASVNPGNSGGPVIDSNGRVIGIVNSKARNAEALSLCIPVEDLIRSLQNLESTTEEQRVQVEKEHNLRVVFSTVRGAGRLYQIALQTYLESMEASLIRGGTARQGMAAASLNIDSTVAGYNSVLTGDLKNELSSTLRDKAVSSTVRDELQELWMVYRDLKLQFDAPSGSIDSYREKAMALGDRFQRLSESLSLLLDVDL